MARAVAGFPICSLGISLKKEIVAWSLLIQRSLPSRGNEHTGVTVRECHDPFPKSTVRSVGQLHLLMKKFTGWSPIEEVTIGS